MEGLFIRPVAYARNGFTDKFGIPRQVQADTVLRTRIVFVPECRSQEALRGLEGFTHLWLLWGFHGNQQSAISSQQSDFKNLKLTVRPPRLGGNIRMGVFATRSPFRPNPIGLTSVRLVGIEQTEKEGAVLIVEGADMLDGTPIYDIKPYLRYCDSHPEAQDGFVQHTPRTVLRVAWQTDVPKGCPQAELEEILGGDPRPAYQQDSERVYRMDYAGWNIQFRVKENVAEVLSVCKKKKTTKKSEK